jgi:hypothetical protein
MYGHYKFHASGTEYIGNISDVKKNGFGKEIIPNLGVYEGNFCDDRYSGYGIFKHENGDIFEGI